MGAWTIIYLSGCILSLGYGVLITERLNTRDLMVLFTLSTLSWLSLFALFLGHGFNIFNKHEREELFSVNIHDIPLKPTGEKKIISGIQSHFDTTHYDLADSRRVIVGKVFTSLNLYIIGDYPLLHQHPSCEAEPASGHSAKTKPGFYHSDPFKNMLFEIAYTIKATGKDPDENKCTVILNQFSSQIENTKILLQISGERSGIVYFDLMQPTIEIEKLPPDSYKIRLIDLKTGKCIFEKVEIINRKAPIAEKSTQFNHKHAFSELAKARVIVSNGRYNPYAVTEAAEEYLLNLLTNEAPVLLPVFSDVSYQQHNQLL